MRLILLGPPGAILGHQQHQRAVGPHHEAEVVGVEEGQRHVEERRAGDAVHAHHQGDKRFGALFNQLFERRAGRLGEDFVQAAAENVLQCLYSCCLLATRLLVDLPHQPIDDTTAQIGAEQCCFKFFQ